MRISTRCLVFMLSVLCLHSASSQQLCPWLNQATASGALGAEVTMRAKLLPASPYLAKDVRPDSTCTFSTADGRSVLEIRVTAMADAKKQFAAAARSYCPNASRSMVGVGNDATACSSGDDHDMDDRVVAYVRNRLMLLRYKHPLTVSIHWQGSDVSAEAVMQAIAEQVAGSMY